MIKIILSISFMFLASISAFTQSTYYSGTWTADAEKSTGVSAEKAGGTVTISQDKTTFKYAYRSDFHSATIQCLLDGSLTKFKLVRSEGKCLYKQVSNT